MSAKGVQGCEFESCNMGMFKILDAASGSSSGEEDYSMSYEKKKYNPRGKKEEKASKSMFLSEIPSHSIMNLYLASLAL